MRTHQKKHPAMRIVSFLLLLISSLLASAQKDTTLQLRFVSVYNKPQISTEPIQLQDSSFFSNDKDSIEIRSLKFYISGIELYNNRILVWKEPNSYHLVDAANEKTCSLPLAFSNQKDFDILSFNLGIDSATNVMGVQGGDLDPMRGMYWTWQSGYINFKLEGTSPLCNTRHHAFEFHIGGYHYPYNTLQRIQLSASKDINTVAYLDIGKFLHLLNLAQTNQLMTPGRDALRVAEQLAKCFHSQYDIK